MPNLSPAQKRLSIYNWNPGPRRGKEGASEKQTAGKWHIITLQEAIDYVTHYGGCGVLSNKDTFYPDIEVKPIYLHDTRRELLDKVMEGDPGWVLQGVLSRASFRRRPLSCQKTFTVVSLHVGNIYVKKRSIAKKLILTFRAVMIGEHVDLVAGEFNGTAWRCSSRNNISTIEEAFADCALPTPLVPTVLWGPGSIPGCWTDVCGFLKPSDPSHIKLLACARPIKAATTRHGSTSNSSIGAAFNHTTKGTIDEFF